MPKWKEKVRAEERIPPVEAVKPQRDSPRAGARRERKNMRAFAHPTKPRLEADPHLPLITGHKPFEAAKDERALVRLTKNLE